MARYAASISDIYGPSASALFPTTASSSVPMGGTTGTNVTTAPQGGGAPSVPVTSVLQGLQGSILGQPLTWLFGLVLFLVAAVVYGVPLLTNFVAWSATAVCAAAAPARRLNTAATAAPIMPCPRDIASPASVKHSRRWL